MKNFTPKSYYVVGFTNVYYTLWNVTQSIRYSNSTTGEVFPYIVENFTYIQNLSTNELSALQKASELGELNNKEVIEEFTLRGEKSFFERKLSPKYLPDNVFTFGKLYMQDITTCDDVWQLNRARTKEIGETRQQLAHSRLIELNAIQLYNNEWILSTEIQKIKDNAAYEANAFKHYLTDGKRVELNVKLIKNISYDGFYGTTWIYVFQDDNNQIFTYKGTSTFNIDKDNYTKIKGTIKHASYKDKPQTIIQRIKVIN
jgi:hypothetical protein